MKRVFVFAIILLNNLAYSSVHLGPGQTYSNIEKAFSAGAIQAGDTVYLHAGSYYGYQGIQSLKGTADKWIVITVFQNDKIDIAGTWQFMSCEYIKFLKLTFRGNASYPGRLLSVDNSGSCTTQSRFIKVDSCDFSNVTDANSIAGFKFGGVDNFELTNNYFHEFTAVSTIDFNVCHKGIIRGNVIENCLTGGHIKGGSSDITMERNLFINASVASWVAFELGGDTGAQFYCPGDNFEVKNLKFYSNIIIGGYRGLALSSAVDCKVVNNTFYNCGQATMRFLTTSTLYPALSGNIVENNIFAFGSSAYINGGSQPAKAASVRNNIYYSTISSPFSGPYWDTPELNEIKEQNPMTYGSDIPMFANPNYNDFHLIKDSPAIGSGSNLNEPVTDFYGNTFNHANRSIGAVEYNIPSEIKEAALFEDLIISPNPASDYIEISGSSVILSEAKSRNGVETSVAHPVLIFDVLGMEITTPSLRATPPYQGGEKVRIDVSHLSTGVYFVRVGDRVQKFVKM